MRRENTAMTEKLRWANAALRRRFCLLALIILPSLLAARTMYLLLPHKGDENIELAMVGLFGVLFAWISVGFWTALAGVWVTLRGYDRFTVTLSCPEALELPNPEVRTAILFPVYNEDVKSFMAGIRTVLHSLRGTGQASRFDIFILSDSTNPESWVAEEEAWHEFCREEEAFGQVFYRRRRSNLSRKSGNIADFCRRWGANYRYMIVYDADSLMRGATMIRMVQAMELHPSVGILQTPPKAMNSRSLISRVQQFANHLYGPVFAAGLHYWQLGEAQYWGHNAIIRIEPFMAHCQLPRLPGKGPLSGEILSHDFVESALMRKAGYGVWLAYELDGSWEETPPTLIDELIRDRRWCQGNLQHSRLIFAHGFFPTHRALFVNGIMSYGSALLWGLFLIISSLQAIVEILVPPTYFPSTRTLFPVWPTWYPQWALTLLSSTAVLLFLPKLLAMLLVISKGAARGFGGVWSMSCGVLGEIVVSTFLAPVRMLFHSLFVVTTLLGWRVTWSAQNRGGTGTSWADAFRFHWWGTLLGFAWGGAIWVVNPGFFWWLSPIVAGLALSIPLSVWSSRASWGETAKHWGLFLTPPEIRAPEEIAALAENLRRPTPYSPFLLSRRQGFIRAVVIPSVHALHIALNRHQRRYSPAQVKRMQKLEAEALEKGPNALDRKAKSAILSDPASLHRLHVQVWELEDGPQAAQWGLCPDERE